MGSVLAIVQFGTARNSNLKYDGIYKNINLQMEKDNHISDKFTIDELLHRSWKHKDSKEMTIKNSNKIQ